MVFTLAKNATKSNPFEIISLQTTRKKNNWKIEETLARTAVILDTNGSKVPILDIYDDDDDVASKQFLQGALWCRMGSESFKTNTNL
jgi:hypothetical protein